MVDIPLQRFQQVGLDHKIGLAGDGSGALAERPATKSLGGRIVGHFQNLRAEHRAEKLEVMKAFKAALQAEYGNTIGAAAFADAVGQLSGKSLSGRQIERAITAAETIREQLLTANLGQIARQGPGGGQFALNLQKIGIQADGLSPNSLDTIKSELQRGLHETGGGRPILAERPLGSGEIRERVQTLARTELALLNHLPGGDDYTRVATALKIDPHDIDIAKVSRIFRENVHAEAGHGTRDADQGRLDAQLGEALLQSMCDPDLDGALPRPEIDRYHARHLAELLPGGAGYDDILKELGLDRAGLGDGNEADIATKLRTNVNALARFVNGAQALPPGELRALTIRTIKDQVEAIPYLPGGDRFTEAARALGIDPDSLDQAKLHDKLVDNFQGNTTNGQRINTEKQLATALHREHLGEAVRVTLPTVREEEQSKALLSKIEAGADPTMRKTIASVISARVNVVADRQLAAKGSLGEAGIVGVARDVIRTMAETQASIDRATREAVAALGRVPPDGAAFSLAIAELGRQAQHVGTSPEDQAQSLLFIVGRTLAELPSTDRDKLFDALSGEPFKAIAREFAGNVAQASNVVIDGHPEGFGEITRLGGAVSAFMAAIGNSAEMNGKLDVGSVARETARLMTDDSAEPIAGSFAERLIGRAMADRNIVDTILTLHADKEMEAGGIEGRQAQNAFVATVADIVQGRLLATQALGGDLAATLLAIRQEINDHDGMDGIRKAKALSIVDKAEAQLKAGAEIGKLPALAGFPPAEAWRLLMDGHLQQARGEYGFENEQGYMAGMLNGLATMLASIGDKQPMTAALFERFHDVSVDKVYSKPLIVDDSVEMRDMGRLKQGYRTDDGSNAGVGFPFKPVRTEEDGRRMGTMTVEGRRELEERIEGDDWYSIDIGKNGAPDKLWCVTKSSGECSARVDSIFETFYKEMESADTEDEKLEAIARCCQSLDQSHVFEDGNIRTVAFLVMNKLLLEAGLSPAILDEPNVFDGFSVGQLVDEIKAGQATFRSHVEA